MDRVRGHMQSRAQSQYTAVQRVYPVLWTWSLSREVTSFEEPSWSSTGWLLPVITDWRANSQVCVLATSSLWTAQALGDSGTPGGTG